MSYSAELKKVLKEISQKKKCCRFSFHYGEVFAMPEGKKAEGIDFTKYGYMPNQTVDYINKEVFRCQSCKSAFLRGIFCVSGTVSNPEKSFHFELKFKDYAIADALYEFISDNCLEMKRIKRKDGYSLYLKKGDDIEDIIHFMGADKQAFEFANEKIKRDFANLANRQNNFEVVNINKTVNASGDTIKAIKKLEKKGVLTSLPDSLKETAELRVENPFANLEELAELHNERITKSGVNHRLKKLMELADDI